MADTTGLAVALVVYFAALFVVGFLAYRRKRAAEQSGDKVNAHFGGAFGPVVLLLTTFSSLYSGYTVAGVPTEAGKLGFFAIRWIPAITMVVCFMLVYYPRMRRLKMVRGYNSPTDFVYDRFRSRQLQLTCSVLLCLPQVFYLTVQFVSFAGTLNGYTGIPKIPGMVILAVVCFAMEMVGGMNSVVLSDALQAFLMIGGFIMVVIFCSIHFGTFQAITPSGCDSLAYVDNTSAADDFSYPSLCAGPDGPNCQAFGCVGDAAPNYLLHPTRPAMMSYFWFIFNFIGFALNPHMVQRAHIARTDLTFKRVLQFLSLSGFLAMPPGIVMGVTYSTFKASWPAAYSAGSTFAAVGMALMDKGPFEYLIVALLTCAVMAAVMSTADSVIMGVSNTIAVDMWQNTLDAKYGSKLSSIGPFKFETAAQRTVFMGHVISLALIIVSVFVGMLITSAQFGALLTLQNGILLNAVPTYILGLYTNRASVKSLMTSIGAGVFTFLVLFLIGQVAPEVAVWTTWAPPANIGAIVNVLVLLMMLPAMQPGEPSDKQLSHEKLAEIMGGTKEPNKVLLLVVMVLCLFSCPFFGTPGEEQPIVMGFPAWSFAVLVLQIVCVGCLFLSVTSWVPGEEEARVSPQPETIGHSSIKDVGESMPPKATELPC